jgi:hypothetical protein
MISAQKGAFGTAADTGEVRSFESPGYRHPE